MIYHIKRVFQLIIQLATSFFCTIRKDSTNIWMSSLETVQTHTTKMQEGWLFRSTVTKIWDLLPIMSITDPKALVSLSIFTQAFLLPLLQFHSPVTCVMWLPLEEWVELQCQGEKVGCSEGFSVPSKPSLWENTYYSNVRQ